MGTAGSYGPIGGLVSELVSAVSTCRKQPRQAWLWKRSTLIEADAENSEDLLLPCGTWRRRWCWSALPSAAGGQYWTDERPACGLLLVGL